MTTVIIFVSLVLITFCNLVVGIHCNSLFNMFSAGFSMCGAVVVLGMSVIDQIDKQRK